MPKSKLVGGFAEAVAGIPDGATIAFGGFAGPGTPYNLIQALLAQGARNLTCVSNTTGGAHLPRMPDIGMLVENGQVRKVVCSFTAATRPTDVLPFARFPGVDTLLGPEMRSTGEVMGWDRNFPRAFLKAHHVEGPADRGRVAGLARLLGLTRAPAGIADALAAQDASTQALIAYYREHRSR